MADNNHPTPDAVWHPDVKGFVPDLSIVKHEIPCEKDVPKTSTETALLLTQSQGILPSSSSFTDDNITITVNVGDMDISCLNEEIDLGTDIKVPGLGGTLPIPESPIKEPRRPKDRDKSKIVRSAEKNSRSDSTKSGIKPKDRDKSKIVRSADKRGSKHTKIIERLLFEDDNIINEIKCEGIEEFYDSEPEVINVVKEETPFYGNKIILGNKKSILNERMFNAQVVLTDCAAKLAKSKKYCNKCKLLFSSLNAFANHKNAKHKTVATSSTKSPNKALIETQNHPKPGSSGNDRECGLCQKEFCSRSSLLKHVRNVHNINSDVYIEIFLEHKRKLEYKRKPGDSKNKVDIRRGTKAKNYCSHCNKVFPNADCLVKHQYALLGLNMLDEDLNEIRNEVVKEAQDKTLVMINEDLDKIRDEVIREAKSKLGVVSDSVMSDTGDDDSVDYGDDSVDFDVQTDTNDCIDNFKCRKCDAVFDSYVTYAKHELEHTNLETRKAKDFIVEVENLTMQQIKQKSAPKDLFKHKCKICKEKFESLRHAAKHVQDSHPDKSTASVIRKINNINKVAKRTLASYNTIICPPISKNILFKCNTCDLNYFSSSAVIVHKTYCNGTKDSWKCNKCHNSFKLGHKAMHKTQHLYSNKFKVITVGDKNLYNRVLNKCPHCAVHFTEGKFFSHYQNCGKETPDAAYCINCDILIDSSHFKTHKSSHNSIKKDDFIIVEYEIFDTELDQKDEDHEEIPASKKMKVDETLYSEVKKSRIQMLYCNACESYLNNTSDQSIADHFENKCNDETIEMCKKCALTFTKKSMEIHEKQHAKGFALAGTLFYDLNLKQIQPPFPPFPRCHVCMIFFFDVKERDNHSCCNTLYIKCFWCRNDFTQSCFEMHKSYHFYSDSVNKMPFSKRKFAQIQAMLLLRIRKPFTFYQCVECDAVLKEKNVKSHQKTCGTINNENKKCSQCKLNVSSDDYPKHVLMHDDASFHRYNMQIIPFDGRSDIIKVKKSVKAKLLDNTHNLSPVDNNTESQQFCESNGNVNYKVDHDNNYDDSSSDSVPLIVLKKQNTNSDVVVPIEESESSEINMEKISHSDQFVLDKACKISQLDLFENDNEEDHELNLLNEENEKSEENCKLKDDTEIDILDGTDQTKSNEIDANEQEMSINECNDKLENDVQVKSTENLETNETKSANEIDVLIETLYKCVCGLHFMTEDGILKHMSSGCQYHKSGQKCPKCHISFTPSDLFDHLLKHHGKKCKFEFDIIEINP